MLTNLELLQALEEGAVVQPTASGELEVVKKIGHTAPYQLAELQTKGLIRREGESLKLTQKGYEALLPDQIA